MAEKRDYSPYETPAPEAEKRRRRRFLGVVLGWSHLFWAYALVLAGIILLAIYLTGGFGAGGE